MIKFKPQDFIVEEKIASSIAAEGSHRLYLLQKSDWNTLDLIRQLSRSLSIPFVKFSYGGKKDRHALTSQYITIQDPQDFSRKGKGFLLKSQGFLARPMGPDLMAGNAFTITLRNLKSLELVEKNFQEIKQSGFPNFF
jgi:tRNA pseudouridine13 synthase